MEREWNPKARTDNAWTHSASGGLSTVITPAWSNAPYTNACQLEAIEGTAALQEAFAQPLRLNAHRSSTAPSASRPTSCGRGIRRARARERGRATAVMEWLLGV